MKYLPLIWANLKRNKLRTVFTFCSIFFALLLFGTLSAVKHAFAGGADSAQVDRLRMIHKVSVIQALPVRYYHQVVATKGVAHASYVSWFSGEYQDPGNFFMQLAVSETYLDLHTEYVVDPEQRARWHATRTGAIVGRALASRFDWAIGDQIPLRRAIYAKADGSDNWDFTVEGIFEGASDDVDQSLMLFHHEYLEESSPWAKGEVRWIEIETAPNSNPAVVAKRLDDQFATSGTPTKTSTERAFLRSFANQVGDTALIITSVVGVTFFVILLVVANAIAHSVSERLPEFGVLKALGFSDSKIMVMVVAECGLMCAAAGVLGLIVAMWLTQLGVPTLGMTGAFRIPPQDMVTAMYVIIGLTLVSACGPALRAYRLNVAASIHGR